MAKRLNPRHQEMVRAKIQTSQLINRLQNEAHGKVSLTAGQRESAKFLIGMSLSKPPEQTDLYVTGELTLEQMLASSWKKPKPADDE